MLIEAVGKTITYRWPHGEVRLEPGTPVELPDDRARKLLQKAPGKVRAVPNWLAEWRAVCDLTYGITADDPRIPGIMDAIGLCDRVFAEGDFKAFVLAREGVKRACQKGIVHG